MDAMGIPDRERPLRNDIILPPFYNDQRAVPERTARFRVLRDLFEGDP